jgi:hypothetical protein
VTRPVEELIGCLVDVRDMIEEGELDEFRRLCRGDLTDKEVEIVKKDCPDQCELNLKIVQQEMCR